MKTLYGVKLTKIESNHKNLRTDTVEGVTEMLPTVGESFILIGKPLTEGAIFRTVFTTEIQFVERMGNEIMFKTRNSTYKVEIITEDNFAEESGL
jgi:hypothetical protein